MDLSIVPEHSFCVLRGLGQRPNKHETGGLRVNGIRLFSQSGYRFALLTYAGTVDAYKLTTAMETSARSLTMCTSTIV